MNKKLVFKYNQTLKVNAKFEVFNDRIKMTLPNVIYCTESKTIDTKTFIYNKSDMLWKSLLGSKSAVDSFVKQGKKRIFKIDLAPLFFKKCDRLGVRK